MYGKDKQNTAVLVALPVMIAYIWKEEGHVEQVRKCRLASY